MPKSDCHFYRWSNFCVALTEMLCNCGKCSFYKTEKEHQECLKKYPPINYKELYEIRHKNNRKRGADNE